MRTSFGSGADHRCAVDSEAPIDFPTCREPTDIVHLPTLHRTAPISFAHCRPAKQWLRALLPSGAYLGLAPSASLSQTRTAGLLQQLLEKDVIDVPIWSLLLVNGREGIFSIGGTSAGSLRRVAKETDDMLNPGEHDEAKRDTTKAEPADSLDDAWQWMKVHGAEGWWQILMRGIWVDGIKVLENQPIVLDVGEHSPAVCSEISQAAGQHAFHCGPSFCRPFVLLIHFRKQAVTGSLRSVPRVSLFQPSQDTLRVRTMERASPKREERRGYVFARRKILVGAPGSGQRLLHRYRRRI